MARSKAREERIKAVVAALLAAEAEEESGRPETIDDIENEMVALGDLVAREFAAQKLAQHTSRSAASPKCPQCGGTGVLVGRRSRELITRRGAVPLSEAKYRCPRCRHFFPSDGSVGD